MHLRTVAGAVELEVWRGKDPQTQRWGIPIREVWGLLAGQRMSPALEEKLVFTATLASSYEGASQVAGQWGCPVDDSVIHALVQRLGERAEAQVQERLKQAPPPVKPPLRRTSELALHTMASRRANSADNLRAHSPPRSEGLRSRALRLPELLARVFGCHSVPEF